MSLTQGVDVFVLDEALRGLALFDPRAAMVLELRLLGGLSVQEIAEVLQVSAKSVRQDWTAAKEWLLSEMRVVQNV